jgi:hypothetical protein
MKILFLFTLLALPVWAEDWNINGHYYYSVKVITIEPDAVTILDNDGGARISMVDMPADLQARFHYDPVAAKAAADQRLAEEKATADALAVQKQQDALARAQQAKDMAARQGQERQAEEQVEQKKIAEAQAQAIQAKFQPLKIRIIQVLPDGLLANTYVPVEHFASAFSSQTGTTYELSENVVFVQCATNNLVDDQDDTVNACQSGTYAYTDTMGARRTVPKYIGIPLPPVAAQASSDFNPGSMNPPH